MFDPECPFSILFTVAPTPAGLSNGKFKLGFGFESPLLQQRGTANRRCVVQHVVVQRRTLEWVGAMLLKFGRSTTVPAFVEELQPCPGRDSKADSGQAQAMTITMTLVLGLAVVGFGSGTARAQGIYPRNNALSCTGSACTTSTCTASFPVALVGRLLLSTPLAGTGSFAVNANFGNALIPSAATPFFGQNNQWHRE
jgi:hypothetical protein